MSSFLLKARPAASVPIPEPGTSWIFLDDADGALKSKNEFGVVIGSGTVTAVNDVAPDGDGNIELTAASIGLGEVENLSPANMPVSDATQLALEDVAADAAADATSKADAAQSAAQGYADTKASAAQANAISAAAADASAKAATAQAAAISVAAADATAKASAAAAASVPTSAVGSTVASLVAGVVPASQLPSYVDDVLEYANLGAFPGSGEGGKIYVAVNGAIPSNPSKQYRWSGSAYTEISPSPGTTDALTEGASNLYLTAARVRAVVLTGLSVATNAVITAADDVLGGMGKLQAQLTAAISGLPATVRGTVLTGLSLASAAAVTATDTVLIAIGKLQAQVTARLGRQETGGADISLGAIPDGAFVRRSGTALVGDDVVAAGEYDWADRPSAATHAGAWIIIKNLGNRKSLCYSDGTDWLPAGGEQLINSAAPFAAVTGSTSELEFTGSAYTTGTVNFLRANDSLVVRPTAAFNAVTGNNRLIAKIGGSAVHSPTAAAITVVRPEIEIFNNNSKSAQWIPPAISGAVGSSTAAPSTRSIDTATTAITVDFFAQNGDAGTTATLRLVDVYWRAHG